MSPLQLVLTGTALELAYFLFEVPTGIVADTYGRRLSTIIGGLAGLGVGFVVTGLANGVLLVLATAAFMGFVWTFKSSCGEAWITDEVGAEDVGRSFQLGAQAARRRDAVRDRRGGGPRAGSTCGCRSSPAVCCSMLLAAALVVVMPETGFTVRAGAKTSSALASMAGGAAGGSLIRAAADPAADRRDRLLPRRVRRGLRPALGSTVPSRGRSAGVRRPRPGGLVRGPRRGGDAAVAGSSPSRSCGGSPRWGRGGWRGRCWLFDALRIVGLLAFAFCGLVRRSQSSRSGARGSPARSQRFAGPLDVAERERRGLERPRDGASR